MRAKARIRTRNRWWKRRRRSFAATIGAKPGNLPGFLYFGHGRHSAALTGRRPPSPETIIPACTEVASPIATGRSWFLRKGGAQKDGIERADEAKTKSSRSNAD